MTATTEQLLTRLDEAEQAMHDLLTGVKEVSLSYNGRNVSYSQTNINDLRMYIADLQRTLGIKPQRRRGAITVNF